MADETVNQETTSTAQEPDRTFTQAEMDAVIADRLRRERAKFADYDQLKDKAAKYDAAEEAGKSDLQRAREEAETYRARADALQRDIDARNARDKVAAEKGVPASLLTGTTEEECAAQAEAMLKWRGPAQNYPAVPDGGEVRHSGGGKTRDQFADWFQDALKK